MRQRAGRSSFLPRALAGGMVMGAVGFACGFFGPIALSPEANQGPLLGIFITGPLGTFVGAAMGLLCAGLAMSTLSFVRALAALAVVGAGVTLYFSLPEDKFRDFVIDGEVVACEPAAAVVPEARAYWEDAVARYPQNRPQGWRETIPGMVVQDPGVVVTLRVHRRWDLIEHRKPWNRGRLERRDRGARGEERYFSRESEGSCGGYAPGARARYSPVWEYASVSPPNVLPTFLNLHVLREVPERYRSVLPR